jgi:hypothetical protein
MVVLAHIKQSPQDELHIITLRGQISKISMTKQVNCSTVDYRYSYSHTVLVNMQTDSGSTTLVDTESENSIEQEPGHLCFADVYCWKIHHEIA